MYILDELWRTWLKLKVVGCPLARVRASPMAMAHAEGPLAALVRKVNVAPATTLALRRRAMGPSRTWGTI